MNVLGGYAKASAGHFEVFYTSTEECFVKETLEGLLAAESNIRDFFGASCLEVANAVIVPSRTEFDRLVKDYLGVEIEHPSNPARIAQAQRNCMVFLSPKAYEKESIFTFIPEEFERLLAHEYVHIIEEPLSPDIESSQRWWSEGLAVYCSGQWRNEEDFYGNAVAGVRNGSIPSLSSLVSDSGLAYDWGWTVVWYVDREYGRAMIGKIVRECSDGNVFAFLGSSVDSIEKHWSKWLATEIEEIF